jgi:L-lactate dehydrogenase complex protein LldF
MNTCPVYRRSGGHSYGTTVPGPIGSILAPARNARQHHSLPYACSLCGSCSDVCPVKIDLHDQLLTLRGEMAAQRLLPWRKRVAMKLVSQVLRRTWLYAWIGAVARRAMRWLPRGLFYNRFNGWARQRELPAPPRQSFRQQLARRRQRKGP